MLPIAKIYLSVYAHLQVNNVVRSLNFLVKRVRYLDLQYTHSNKPPFLTNQAVDGKRSHAVRFIAFVHSRTVNRICISLGR
ncbi:hypothetical protein [Nostoc sp. UHCC 0302]|uniref:hypothetical protein n=1 Tax=Nostoc sp. UHCC 0302 TaxID=3134896 RepID=UPI00311C99C6